MAKAQKKFTCNNCELDGSEMKLIETTKDGVLVYDLRKILDSWSGLDGLSFSITQNSDVEPDETEY